MEELITGDFMSDAWWLTGWIAYEDRRCDEIGQSLRGGMLTPYWAEHVPWLRECGFTVTEIPHGFVLQW